MMPFRSLAVSMFISFGRIFRILQYAEVGVKLVEWSKRKDTAAVVLHLRSFPGH
jgi:hypothetical protein